MLKVGRSVQMGKNVSSMLLRNGGYFWKGMRLQSETLMKTLAYFGINATKTGAMAVVRTGTLAFNAFFAVYDVYSFVQLLKNNHPTADAISGLIQRIQKELNNLLQLQEGFIEIWNN